VVAVDRRAQVPLGARPDFAGHAPVAGCLRSEVQQVVGRGTSAGWSMSDSADVRSKREQHAHVVLGDPQRRERLDHGGQRGPEGFELAGIAVGHQAGSADAHTLPSCAQAAGLPAARASVISRWPAACATAAAPWRASARRCGGQAIGGVLGAAPSGAVTTTRWRWPWARGAICISEKASSGSSTVSACRPGRPAVLRRGRTRARARPTPRPRPPRRERHLDGRQDGKPVELVEEGKQVLLRLGVLFADGEFQSRRSHRTAGRWAGMDAVDGRTGRRSPRAW